MHRLQQLYKEKIIPQCWGSKNVCVCRRGRGREVWHGQAGGKGEGDASCLFLFDVTLISSSLSFFFFCRSSRGTEREYKVLEFFTKS